MYIANIIFHPILIAKIFGLFFLKRKYFLKLLSNKYFVPSFFANLPCYFRSEIGAYYAYLKI